MAGLRQRLSHRIEKVIRPPEWQRGFSRSLTLVPFPVRATMRALEWVALRSERIMGASQPVPDYFLLLRHNSDEGAPICKEISRSATS
jgi:hypothetical protein